MEIDVQSGRYVVAVSGGVDSMALLHALREKPGLQLVVAHFNHGIRSDADEDRQLVQQVAAAYGLPFVYEEGRLGSKASEDTARAARYAFLERVWRAHQAQAIITAHHQDDVLETAILNLLRGTGRRGLTSLSSNHRLVRPLLNIPKSELIAYARQHQLAWHEDSTNTDERYLRNYVRHRILPRFCEQDRTKLLRIIEDTRRVNQALDVELAELVRAQSSPDVLDRRPFAQLPHIVAKELLASWLRSHDIANFDTKMLERVTIAAKTQAPGAIIDMVGGATLRVTRYTLALGRRER